MIPPTQDSYNKVISPAQILSAYRIFQKIFPEVIKIEEPSQETLNATPLENQRQKTIQIDCHRTRSANFTPQLKKNTEYLLTYYCGQNNIQYKQGLNQIIAPFMLFHSVGATLTECFNLFKVFFQRFFLNFYQDNDFNSLQMMFKMVSIVLRYHSPSLSRYLQIHDIQPQIFAISWFMTLFSRQIIAQQIQQAFLTNDLSFMNDIYFLFFIVVGIILWKNNSIIQSKNHSIFKIVTDMIFKNQTQLMQVIKISMIIRKNTPASLSMFFRDRQIFNSKQNYEDVANLLNHIVKLNLFLILPNQLSLKEHFRNGLCEKQCFFCDCRKLKKNIEIAQQEKQINKSFIQMREISNDLKTYTKPLQYVVIDLRKIKTPLKKGNQNDNERQIFEIDIQKQLLDVESQFMSLYVEYLSKKHFVFLLTTFTFQDIHFSDKEELHYAKQFISILNSYSFPHLGILQGGYTALSIFDSQLQLKSAIFLSNKQIQIKQQQIPCNIRKKQVFDCIYELSISEMYEISDRKLIKSLSVFQSQNNLVILVLDCNYFVKVDFVILIEQQLGFLQFLSYLEHNTSINSFLYTHKQKIKCKIHKIVPLRCIKKISVKIHKKTNVVLKISPYDQKQQLQSLKSYICMDKAQFKNYCHDHKHHQHHQLNRNDKININENNKNSQNLLHEEQAKMKKLIIQLKNEADVKELSDTIMHNFSKKVLPHFKH